MYNSRNADAVRDALNYQSEPKVGHAIPPAGAPGTYVLDTANVNAGVPVPYVNFGRPWSATGRNNQRSNIKALVANCAQASRMSLGGWKHKPNFCAFKKNQTDLDKQVVRFTKQKAFTQGRVLPTMGMTTERGFTTTKQGWANQVGDLSEVERKIFIRHPYINLLDKYNKFLKALVKFNKYSLLNKDRREEFMRPSNIFQKAVGRIRLAHYLNDRNLEAQGNGVWGQDMRNLQGQVRNAPLLAGAEVERLRDQMVPYRAPSSQGSRGGGARVVGRNKKERVSRPSPFAKWYNELWDTPTSRKRGGSASKMPFPGRRPSTMNYKKQVEMNRKMTEADYLQALHDLMNPPTDEVPTGTFGSPAYVAQKPIVLKPRAGPTKHRSLSKSLSHISSPLSRSMTSSRSSKVARPAQIKKAPKKDETIWADLLGNGSSGGGSGWDAVMHNNSAIDSGLAESKAQLDMI